jgi:hypothetical protein
VSDLDWVLDHGVLGKTLKKGCFWVYPRWLLGTRSSEVEDIAHSKISKHCSLDSTDSNISSYTQITNYSAPRIHDIEESGSK